LLRAKVLKEKLLLFFDGGVVLRIELLGLIPPRALVGAGIGQTRRLSWEQHSVVDGVDGGSVGLIFVARYQKCYL
jgi:hypothetical protein